MTGFKTLAETLEPSGSGFKGHVPENWKQGRTAYGGLTTGLALAAALKVFPNLPALRSMQMTFVGPVTGEPMFKPVILRQGRNVTSVKVDVLCEDNVSATAIFIFAAARELDLMTTLPAPQAPAPQDCELFTPPQAEAMVPVFFLRFETRLIAGHRPMSGAKDGYIRAWSRHQDEDSRESASAFIALADVLPPAALPTFTRFGPVSSINWQMNILKDPETDDGWWHVETKLSAAQDGYSSQIMRFWNRQGDLVAEGMQSVAIFV